MKKQRNQGLLGLGTLLMMLMAVLAAVSSLGGVFSPALQGMHQAWWFRALLAWGGLALAICGVRSLVELVLRVNGHGIRGVRPPGAELVSELHGLTVERVANVFRGDGYRVVGRWDLGTERIVEGVLGWPGWLGRGLVHCGLAVVLLGAGVDGLLGWSSRYVVGSGGRVGTDRPSVPLVFVADSIHWSPQGGWAAVELEMPTEPGLAAVRTMRPGDALKVSGSELRLASIAPSRTWFLSARIRARHVDGWERDVELPAGAPVRLRATDSLTAIAYLPPSSHARSTGRLAQGHDIPAGPALHVRVARGDTVNVFWVTPLGAVGSGSSGWKLSLLAVTPAAEASFQIRSKPGDPLVAAGLLAFAVGTVCSVGFPVRRVWAIIGSDGEATLGSHGPLANRSWQDAVGRLVAALVRDAGGDEANGV